MMGASGAVGAIATETLAQNAKVSRLTLLNRRELPASRSPSVSQHTVDVTQPSSYASLLAAHDVAVCCLGVGQPSKVSQEALVAIDKTAVLAFATACRAVDVRHFVLLSAVGASASSMSFYLRTKGELQDGIAALGFAHVSFVQPSIILTPTNRYDWTQGLTLAVWPSISKVLFGPLKKYRGIPVATLGRAIARQALVHDNGVSTLHWETIEMLGR
jgi:uncharacterized protein YbjT (DUF2867 family)